MTRIQCSCGVRSMRMTVLLPEIGMDQRGRPVVRGVRGISRRVEIIRLPVPVPEELSGKPCLCLSVPQVPVRLYRFSRMPIRFPMEQVRRYVGVLRVHFPATLLAIGRVPVRDRGERRVLRVREILRVKKCIFSPAPDLRGRAP